MLCVKVGTRIHCWFHHGEAPTLPKEFKYLDLLPTARRVVWLAQQLPNKWTEICMNNLFNSRKIFAMLYLSKALGHGVVRTHGRGLPSSVIQTEEKNTKRAESLRGATKAARLSNQPEYPNLITVSVYNMKPVYALNNLLGYQMDGEKEESVVSGRSGINLRHIHTPKSN